MPKEIELQNGMKAIVDDEDYERVVQHVWSLYVTGKGTTFNVQRHITKTKKESLSSFVLGLDKRNGKVVRHNNKNSLDFRKSNLSILQKSTSIQMNKGRRNTSSKYKGVCWLKRRKKWVANIKTEGKVKYLGSFSSEDYAAMAYNKAALEYFGEHAYQNIIGEDNSSNTLEINKTAFHRRNTNETTSKFRGVTLLQNGNWKASIKADGQMKFLGNYKTEIEAAIAYNEKAKELFGDKAILNDIPNKEESSC